jgi:hypothetical protein
MITPIRCNHCHDGVAIVTEKSLQAVKQKEVDFYQESEWLKISSA